MALEILWIPWFPHAAAPAAPTEAPWLGFPSWRNRSPIFCSELRLFPE
jgi:hypothetical protein